MKITLSIQQTSARKFSSDKIHYRIFSAVFGGNRRK